MLSFRRWVTVLVGADFGKTESFKPFSSDVIKPVKVRDQAVRQFFTSFPPSILLLTLSQSYLA